MKKLTVFLLFVLLFTLTVFKSFSQNDVPKKYHLTHEMSAAEKELMKTYSHTRTFSETAPPTGEIRNVAEWEPMESVIVAYDGGFGVPVSLIADMSQVSDITTIVANSSEENSVRNTYSSNGVNLSRCHFMYQDPNSWWTRDYSPWFIAVDNSEVAIINFPYNRPRPNDDDVPILTANELGIDLYGMNVTHTGGNYMCDGYGTAVSTDLVWDENTSLSHAEINTKMHDYLGIQNYHVTADPLDDYIKHVDCWGKFLDVDKILITRVPVTDYRYDDYEAIATYFSQQNCSWGYPYEIIRVQAADHDDYDVNPYSNSLILNGKIYVPQTGSNLDDDAVATYTAAMPGYEIVPVYSSGWYNTDALHCRTHGIADREMLYIKHIPLHGDLAFQSQYTVEADVTSYGGSPVSSGFPKLYYRQNGGTWQETLMTLSGGITYSASIPAVGGDNTVEYYIYAENDNGKTRTYPFAGTADPFTFNYTGGNFLTVEQSEICIGNSTGTISLTNYTETITDWEKRLDGGTWTSIGITSDTYSETPPTSGLWEYRVVLDGGSSYSTIASIIVNELPVAGTAYASTSEICFGENFEMNLSGYTGNFLWQISADEITWYTIEDGETSPYTVSGLNQNAYFRAKVFNGVCDTIYSNHVFVTVNPSAEGGTVSAAADQICTGETASLSLSGYDGNIQWQNSNDGTTWNNISGANSDTYSSEALTSNTFFRANVSMGSCPDAQSDEIEITVFEIPVSGFTYTADNQTISFTNTSVNAVNYNWDFGDGNSSSQEDPVYVYSFEGNYTVSLTASNNVCEDDIYNETISVSYVGISELNSGINISPNPNKGIFIIKTIAIPASIHVFDINGKEVYLNRLASKKESINLSNLNSGIYFIKIEDNSHSYFKKLIIKK
ncbi:MAG: hypothetical protein DRI94_02735 [Bacteroidetes bacterium]|nr:MAG: hypothetical protein DRI94_02735 [Bacteroidota bacterium]